MSTPSRTDAIRPKAVRFVLALLAALALALPATAQDPVQGEILQQDLDRKSVV